ncbi:nonstructural protein [Apis mellifera associated microvirus 23]|nr:nonstructural protein [Apis mellifera associated microvirus 23]
MMLKMFSIRDSKAEVYYSPFFAKSHGEAERNFRELTNDQKSTVSKYPEDFDLYYLGTYDDSTGKLAPVDTPQHLMKAVNVVNQKPTSLEQ